MENHGGHQLLKGLGSSALIFRLNMLADEGSIFWSSFCRSFRNFPKLRQEFVEMGMPKNDAARALFLEILLDGLESETRISIWFWTISIL